MLFLFRTPLPQMKPIQPTPSSTHNRPITPLDISELLCQIFSYLDTYTLAQSVVLVCRQWFFLNHSRLSRTLTWDINWQPFRPKYALARLPGAERLILGYERANLWNAPNAHGALESLQRSQSNFWSTFITPLLLRQDEKAAHIKNLLDRPLQEFVIATTNRYNISWLDTLPFPNTLRSLTIVKNRRANIDVPRILVTCPVLESLHITGTAMLIFHGPLTEQGKSALPNHLRLRSLVLEQPRVKQSWIEHLLTITPDLEDLRLIIVSWSSRNDWEWSRFRDHLKTLSLPLKRFHHSIERPNTPDEEYQKEVLAVCPQAQEHTVLAYHFTPWMVKTLMDWPVYLTTLDILHSRPLGCARYGWLSEYTNHESIYTAWHWHYLLCECPKLRYLKTLKMPYMPDYMDIHRRGPMYSSEGSSPLKPGIWICRELETLNMELHVHEHAKARGTAYTRVVYGYLSRICPRLHDLRITFTAYCQLNGRGENWRLHPYVLEGGLCLLSKLRYLEQIRVDYSSVECEIAELNWLCRSGRSEEHRYRRRQLVDGWTWRLEQEAELDTERMKNRTVEDEDVLGVEGDYDDLMSSIRHLGLLQDVKELLLEMDRGDFECLPELQVVACGNHLPRRPEREMGSLFSMEPPGLVARLADWNPF
ncbi:hypothetical protein K457DRAFT_886258 [Linnemannia elongata AG-77]|uniref:F-box domain-containing protein n=1 Tax=Linnemannia elongata AG-77 TaxID=1314771 RepID=A0A197KH40_9FUNG|nr:hypothetical protein K457DRAFT_886258 [Linnemannia elongata AG-77]